MGGWPRPESRCPQRLWPAAAALTGCRVEAEVGSAELLGDRGRRAARGWVGEGVERRRRKRRRCGPRSRQVPQ